MIEQVSTNYDRSY